MPVKSERAVLVAELENLLRHMILEGDDKSVEFTEIMDIYEAVTGSRYYFLPLSRDQEAPLTLNRF
jgi:hypothetical protein